MRLKAIADHNRVVRLEDWPTLDLTGTTAAATILQAIIADGATNNRPVEGCAGRLNIDATVTLNASLHGPSFPYAPATRGGLMLVPSFSSATTPVLDAVSVDGVDLRDVFIGNPSATSPASATSAIGLRLGRQGQTPQETYKVGRSLVENVRAFGLTTGVSVQGWTNDLRGIHAQYCGVGFIGEYLNASTVDLRLAGNTKHFAISKSDGLQLFALFEGSAASLQSSTIDDCTALRATLYMEQTTVAADAPLLTIGGTTECRAIDLVISVGALMNVTGNIRPILLDRVNGGRVLVTGSVGYSHSLVDTTTNCKNVEIIYADDQGVWPLDTGKSYGPMYNHFPNCDFSHWFAGWQDVYADNVTVTKETTLVRRGPNAVKIQASTAAGVSHYLRFTLSGNGTTTASKTTTALSGKRVKIGAWIWVPNIAEFTPTDPSGTEVARVNLYVTCRDTGGTSVNSDTTSGGTYNHHVIPGAWNFVWSKLDVIAACTAIDIRVYLNRGGTLPDTDAYIVLDSLQIVEDAVPFNDFVHGRITADAPTIDAKVEGGNIVLFQDAAVSDATQTYIVGDEIKYRTTVAAGNRGEVCTTAGVGGTAVFKAFGVIAA
jgi:hypothetical protein